MTQDQNDAQSLYRTLEEEIVPDANVELVGEFDTSPFGFGRHKEGVRPSDHK